MKMMARQECETAKQIRHKMESAKNEAQKKHFRDLLDAHKRNCAVCGGRK